MGVVVSFNYQSWIQRYPEFNHISQPQANEYFQEAQLYVRNDGGGPVNDSNQQSMFLNMVTAHIAALYAKRFGGQPATELVGRISTASEGSVSVTAEMAPTSDQQSWFLQTKYGASYWQASRPYRVMRWMVPHRRRIMNPWGGPWTGPWNNGGFTPT